MKKKCTLCNGTGRIVTERHSENLITVRACPKCNKKGPVVDVGNFRCECTSTETFCTKSEKVRSD